jgi:hypothetical protein
VRLPFLSRRLTALRQPRSRMNIFRTAFGPEFDNSGYAHG